MENRSTIAIIGLGNIGKIVAGNLVKGNRPVIVADRNPGKATALAEELGELAQAMDIPEAIKSADIVILAIWFNAIKELLYQYEGILKGKIIVDPSNPIAPNDKGGFDKIIGENESAGRINAQLLPENAVLVKALGTLGAASLSGEAFRNGERAVLFYAADDENINSTIEQLIRDNGFEPLRVGGIDQSIRIEVFGDLHEFGALGQTVTLAEAMHKV